MRKTVKERFKSIKSKAFVVVSTLLLTAPLAGADFTLVKCNQAKCSIVLPPNASQEIVKSVSNFNHVMKTITGTQLPVVGKDISGNRIVIALRKLDSLWTADNFTIKFPDSRTLAIEGTEVSVQWAFNHIITEYAKAEWVLPEECGLSYTPLKDLVIPAKPVEVKDVSWSLSRTLSLTGPWWKQNLRSGTKYFSHTLTKYAFPLSKYGKDNSWPKAIMPVLNGKKITALPNPQRPRHFWQPCYSNPETAKIAVENLQEYMKKYPETLAVGLTVNDNEGYCECSECLKIDRRAGRGRSETYCMFINRVADGICKKYPNLLIVASAYSSTYLPPTFKLHPNVIIHMTIDFNSCVNPKVHEKHKRIIAEWGRKASILSVWDYSWGYPYPMPRLYAPYHLDMLKYIFEHNGRAYDAESWTNDAHEGPKHYLIGKLLWNSKQDMKKLEEEWYVRCVGNKAAPYLKAYYKIWNDYFTGPALKTPWGKSAPTVYMTYYDVSCVYALREEDIQSADQAMKQVVALAETEQEKQRAELMMRLWRHTFLRLRLLGAGVYDPQGFIHTPQQALKLLDYVSQSPEYIKEYGRISNMLIKDSNIKAFYLSQPMIRAGGSPIDRKFELNLSNHVLSASQFSEDPAVKQHMNKIASDPAQSSEVRELCSVLADLKSQINLLPDGNAEKGITTQFSIHRLTKNVGTLSITDHYAEEGKKSFQVEARAHRIVFNIETPAKPMTKYLLSFKAFIPKPSAEGYLMAYGLLKDYPFHITRGKTWLKLSGGVWQTFVIMISTRDQNKIWFRIHLENFDKGDKVYFDDLRLIEIKKPAKSRETPSRSGSAAK